MLTTDIFRNSCKLVRILSWRLGSIWWCMLSFINGQGNFFFVIISSNTRFEVTWDAAPAACQAQWPSDKQYKDFTVGLATIRDDYDNNLIASMMYNKDTNYDVSFGYNQVSHNSWFINLNDHVGCLDWILWRKIKLWKYKIRMEKFRFLNSLHKLGSQRTKCRPFQSWCTDWCFYGTRWKVLAIRYRNIPATEILIWFFSANQPTTQLPYVCKAFLAKPRPDDDRGILMPCDSEHGWYPSSTHDDHGHFCMRVFTDKKPFYEADHTCTAIHGGHLVSIHSG